MRFWQQYFRNSQAPSTQIDALQRLRQDQAEHQARLAQLRRPIRPGDVIRAHNAARGQAAEVGATPKKGGDMNLKILNLDCCGMKDVRAINEPRFTPQKFFEQLCKRTGSYQKPNRGLLKYAGFSHFILSGASDVTKMAGKDSAKCVAKRFTMLKNYIEHNKLGTIVITEPTKSPTYGGKHSITAAIYTPDPKALVAFAREKDWIPKSWPNEYAPGTWG